MFANEKYNEFI